MTVEDMRKEIGIVSIRPTIKEVDWDYAPWYSEIEQEDTK